MKTIKLSTLLLGTTLFLSMGSITVSAEGMKCGAGKCGSAMKIPKAKSEDIKSNSEKPTDMRLMPKAYDNAEWTRKSHDEDYTRGKIKTH